MLNYETILSSYDDKMTLMQWLKKVEEALNHASATAFRVNKKGNATISFILDFEDGTTLESGDIVLQQGESVNGAYMQNGHLFITLTNGQIFDIGNLKPVTRFEIDTSQHLIVYYGDGTNQDLGAIFSGNVNIDGNFTANSIIENMIGYSFENLSKSLWTPIYVGAVKNGNKLTIVFSGTLNRGVDGAGNPNLCYVRINSSVGSKLYPWVDNVLEQKVIYFQKDAFNQTPIQIRTIKDDGSNLRYQIFGLETLDASTDYYFRLEQTFLLSDSLVV